MLAKQFQTAALLALLVSAQWMDGVHGTGHVSTPDDQVCSQCLHARPKQHAALPVFTLALASVEMEQPAAADFDLFHSITRLPPRSRGPPPAI